MNASFDPYHKWLGIAPEEQPPHDYRLLGLRPFESDPDVIANAADRQTLLLRTLQAGIYRTQCQRLLNEISGARVRLLDPERKQSYDAELRVKLARPAPAPQQLDPAPLPMARPLTPADLAAVGRDAAVLGIASLTPAAPSATSVSPTAPATSVRLRRKKSWMPLAVVACMALFAVASAGIYYIIFAGSPPNELPDPVAQADAADTTDEPQAPVTPSVTNDSPPKPSATTEENPAASLPQAGPGSELSSDPAQDPPEPAPHETTPPQAVTPRSPEVDSDPPPPVEPSPPPEIEQRKTPPDEDALQAARDQVREIFPKEFENVASPEERVKLARFLMEQAAQLKDDPLARYALYIEAIEQSIEAGYFPTAKDAVDAAAPDWEIDRLRYLGRALVAAARSPHVVAMREDLAVAALELVDEAIEARRYDGADQIAGIADGLAAKARDADLRRKTRAAVSRTTRLKRDWQKVVEARKTLETDPENAEANFLVGKYLCLESGETAEGLTHLAQGNHAELQALAQRDLDEQKHPADKRAEEKIELADAWSKLADSEEELSGFNVRAHNWYEQASTIATGLLKTKAERRRDELAENVEVQRLRAAGGARPAARVAGPVDVELKPLGTLLGHTDLVTQLAFSPKGSLLATASNDNKARIWDYAKRKLLFTLPHQHNVQALAWSSDGKLLATGSRDRTIQIWDATKGRIARAFPAHPLGVTAVAFAPGGALLASCGEDESAARLWNLKTATPAGELRGPYNEARAVTFTPDGGVIIGGSGTSGATLWNSAGENIQTFSGANDPDAIAVSPDGQYVAICGWTQTVYVHRLSDGAVAKYLNGSSDPAVAWSPEGGLLAVCGSSSFVDIYDTNDWSVRQQGASSAQRLLSVSFSSDGKTLAACGADAVVRLWEVTVTPRRGAAPPLANASNPNTPAAGNPAAAAFSAPAPAPNNPPNPPTPAAGPALRILASLRPHAVGDSGAPTGLAAALSPDGLWLATGGGDRAVQLLDVSQGALARSNNMHGAPVTAVAIDAKGENFASADDQGVVRLMSFPNFTAPRTFRFDSAVEHMAFTPSGDLILGGRDGKLQEWSTRNLTKSFDCQGHTDAISGLALSPDGQTLFSAGRDGKLIAWSLTDRTTSPRVLRTEAFPIDSLALSPQGDSVALTVSRAGRVIVFDLRTQRPTNIQSAGGQVTAAIFLPDGRTLVLGVSNGDLYLFSREQGQRTLAKAHPGAAVHRLLLSANGARLASVSAEGEVKCWELGAAGQ